MPYATITEVVNTLPQVGSISTITSLQIFTATVRADSVINAMLSRRYTVPITPSPPLLTTICCDLTLYRLMRRFFSGEQQNDSEWPDRYKEAMELLEKLADGEIQLVDSGGTIVVPSAGSDIAWSNTQGYTPTFGEDGDLMSIIDEDKLDDLEGRRD